MVGAAALQAMSNRIRCAIYTCKSSEEGPEQGFNSVQAQREAGEAYVRSRRSLVWAPIATAYDDGGISGGSRTQSADGGY
jgi:site-specific DNA recombinase